MISGSLLKTGCIKSMEIRMSRFRFMFRYYLDIKIPPAAINSIWAKENLPDTIFLATP